MIDQQDTRFEPDQMVTGRRWNANDLVTGRYVEHWGTAGKAVLVELEDGERVTLVASTVSHGEHITCLLARFGVSLEEATAGRHELTEVFAAVPAAEQTTIGGSVGTLDLPTVDPAWPTEEPAEDDDLTGEDLFGLYADDPEPVPPRQGWFRRNLTIGRACVLTAVVSVLATTGVAWLVTR